MSDCRRKERRVRSRGEVKLWLDDHRHIPATICDISVNGISVETKAEIAPGTSVRIDCHGLEGKAIVRYSAAQGSIFRIGMELERIDAAGPAR